MISETNKNIQTIFFLLLLTILPICKTKVWLFKYNQIRAPQYLIFAYTILFIIALSHHNFFIRMFLAWGVASAIFIHPSMDSVYILLNLFIAVWLIGFIQKIDERYIKFFILLSNYLLFIVWILGGIKTNPWIVGAYLAFSLPLILTITKNLYINLGLGLIPFVGIMMSHSRSAIGFICLMLIVYLGIKKQYKLLYIFILLITILGMAYGKNKHLDWSYRKDLWTKTFKKVGFTMTGTGLKTFKDYGFKGGQRHITTHAHNIWIEVYAELGLVGLTLLISFIVSLFFYRPPIEYFMGLIVILLHISVHYSTHIAQLGLLIIIYISLILKYRGGQQKCLKRY